MKDPLLSPEIKSRIQKWLQPPFDEETQKQVKELLSSHNQNILDAIYTDLSFGTAGLRGIMGVGTNRINIYTIRAATQGLSNYIKKIKRKERPCVVIGYDSRKNSKLFAQETAKVFAANDIEV